jgi:hypothetical protein
MGPPLQQLGGESGKTARIGVRPAGLEHVISPLSETDLVHASIERAHLLDRVPDRVLDVEELALEIAPLGEQQPQPIALLALVMSGRFAF